MRLGKLKFGNSTNADHLLYVRRCALKTPVHGDCQICDQPGHVIHFGVLTCRACAAFFRRTVVMNRQYTCRRANESCQISKDERYLCRLCRYNKCMRLGMTPESKSRAI
ncbi:unnamed protein product [Strongylus vulgaris]|uniref:Nuclear receptor domain-containing protein n=1 Tax=Strongylus vulgaris TaxID=40348 RepID=A0A3P7JJB4_STRVU|nr:unnamed protein product [Strongylus vulgaris]